MLGHAGAASCGDYRGKGRDVEGGQAVAPGAAGVEESAIDLDRRRHRTSRAGKPGELLDRLALDAKGDEKAGDLNGGGVPANDLLKSSRSLILGERLTAHELGDRFDHAIFRAARLMKLARIFLPSLVSTDSGWNCTP